MRSPCLAAPTAAAPRAYAPFGAVRPVRRRIPRAVVRATENENATSRTSVDDETLPTEEIQRLAALRRQQNEITKDSSILQGALEEAQLITWPRPAKAWQDTILVLLIVAFTGALILGMNIALAELSEWWYHLG